MDAITMAFFSRRFFNVQKFRENLFYLMNSKFSIELSVRKYIGNSINSHQTTEPCFSEGCICAMHFMFIVPWITQQRWNGIQLHLCDALYVHCAADLRCRAAHAISCICAMHFMFIVPLRSL